MDIEKWTKIPDIVIWGIITGVLLLSCTPEFQEDTERDSFTITSNPKDLRTFSFFELEPIATKLALEWDEGAYLYGSSFSVVLDGGTRPPVAYFLYATANNSHISLTFTDPSDLSNYHIEEFFTPGDSPPKAKIMPETIEVDTNELIVEAMYIRGMSYVQEEGAVRLPIDLILETDPPIGDHVDTQWRLFLAPASGPIDESLHIVLDPRTGRVISAHETGQD
jgi:hypothetical protein